MHFNYVSLLSQKPERKGTYKIPSERTNATVTFFCVVIWTDQIIGIGMIAYIQSVMTVKTEMEYAAATNESPEAHFEF